ncbi:LysM peptidoglycan-binding domain-containing protein [Enterococcus faecalis]|uniref:LysM peptidoglycan-binding domain-containing protein n=1 Tax=Enterococcus faecalis TaxID=1351 RepID=UPI002AFE15F1|nr:LysM peptidoglycan-binding domain-containing protein [Enterococcus faecalis]
MNKTLIKGLVFSSVALGGLLAGNTAHAAEWKANTPAEIQIVDGQTQYTMKWGDTLWAIGQKVNINHVKLAEINGINLNAGEQYRLPVGRVISFNGNVATVKEADGKVVSQAVIQDKDKVDTSKPAGQPVQGNQAQAPQTPTNEQNTTPAQPQAGNQDNTPAGQPVQGNQDVQGTETPAKPAEPSTPVTPVDPSTPPVVVPDEPTKPSEPETPVTPEKDTTPINLGNSGMTFNSQAEAIAYGESQIRDENSKWFGYGFSGIELVNKAYEQLGQWTVDFYNPDKN